MTQEIVYLRDGVCEARIASTVLLLFRVEQLRDDQLQSAFDAALRPVRSQIYSLQTDEIVRRRAVPDGDIDVVAHWLRTPPAMRRPLSLKLSSNLVSEDVAEYSIRLGVPVHNPEHERGILQIVLPMALGIERPELLQTLAVELAQLLPLAWGQAGFCMAYNERKVLDERDRCMAAWYARYRCLQLLDPDRVAIGAYDGLPGLSWLNFVSAALIAGRLGDEASCLEEQGVRVGQALQLFAVSGAPVLGDRNRREDVSDYQRLGQLLEHIMCTRAEYPLREARGC